jgi:hypothetical protein
MKSKQLNLIAIALNLTRVLRDCGWPDIDVLSAVLWLREAPRTETSKGVYCIIVLDKYVCNLQR